MVEHTERIVFDLDGRPVAATVASNRLLIDLLREEFGILGVRAGCDGGVCGACTVLIDGVPATACLMLAVEADGRRITTIRGLERADGTLHPLQRAFLDERALQCGSCTPGMVLLASALLAENPDPDEETIRAWMSAALCRCGGGAAILRAVRRAAAVMREAR